MAGRLTDLTILTHVLKEPFPCYVRRILLTRLVGNYLVFQKICERNLPLHL